MTKKKQGLKMNSVMIRVTECGVEDEVVVACLTLHEQGLQMALLLFYHQVEVAVEVTEGG
jgi:hypothetical protein